MTSEPPTEDLIRYDVMVQDALLGVVRKVLQDAARFGLPGEHHFYVTFRSHAPGVRISSRLREKHPEEMTIVLQHQFWDLIVNDTTFEVGLSFGGVPERLLVPYEALTGFYDPSVQFGLKFTPDEAQADNDADGAIEGGVKEDLEAISTIEQMAKRKSSLVDRASAGEPAGPITGDDARAVDQDTDAGAPTSEKPAKKSRAKAKAGDAVSEKQAAEPAAGNDKPAGGAEVVSLEAFRKKK
jgi:uncharacterized protein